MKIQAKILGFAILLLCCELTRAANVTPELQRQVRGATFEVVQKKPDKDPLSYEKPLPLELLPFIERNDAYRSIGTAFALGNNTYVTAAHVITACIASQFGPPALRSADGHVYAIDRILRFSAHEDFVVFALTDDPRPAPLTANREPHIDDPVLAVGNALGEGIVIRDGLLTSETPEEQDGRWKWLRFSAAASPGNSGGPLLDATGNVIGIVIGKSPNENLNYSLPITRVLDASDAASFDVRTLQSLPFLHATRTYRLKDSFPLPQRWSDFVSAYQRIIDAHAEEALKELLRDQADVLFPKGKGSEDLLNTVETAYKPALLTQSADSSWMLDTSRYASTDLGDDGSVEVGGGSSMTLLRLHRPGNASDAAFYADSKAFMDAALKGLNIKRQVGSDEVLVTSLGTALTNTQFVDSYGRRWQERVWRVPYLDAYIIGLLLPTPDGYVGMMQITPSSLVHVVQKRIELNADLFYMSYWGTLSQWQAFLANRDALPDAFKTLKLEPNGSTGTWRFVSERTALSITQDMLKLARDSVLGIKMSYSLENKRAVWGIGGFIFAVDAAEKNYIELQRQPKVPGSASRELRDTWNDMLQRNSPFGGQAAHDGPQSWTIKSVVDVPGTQPQSLADDLLYALTVHIENPVSYSVVDSINKATLRELKVTEHGSGSRVAAAPPVDSRAEEYVDASLKSFSASLLNNQRNKQFRRDIRGREFTDDLHQFVLTSALRDQLVQRYRAINAADDAGDSTQSQATRDDYQQQMQQVMDSLQIYFDYWSSASAEMNASDRWRGFIARNHLPTDTATPMQAMELEHQIETQWKDSPPDSALLSAVRRLRSTYEQDISRLTQQLALTVRDSDLAFSPSASECAARSLERSAIFTEPPKDSNVAASHVSKSLHDPDDYYPATSQRQFESGSVIVAMHIGSDGCVLSAALAVSSGSEELDDAAIHYANEGLQFAPATIDGKAVPAPKRVVVTFKLR